MAKAKYTFPEPGCYSCENYRRDGNVINETRYCMGVKSKKGKRFRLSDPKFKPPRWCPKRITPVCRVYGFVDEQAEVMDSIRRAEYGYAKGGQVIIRSEQYRLLRERSFGMKAKAFYEAVKHEPVVEVLSDFDLQYGEVIEIDDGLKPYYFYYCNWSTVIPIFSFYRQRTKQQ